MSLLTEDSVRRLAGSLTRSHSRPRRLTYRQAEALAKRLASDLITRFGQDEVKGFHYQAIPRGGLFVLGMLAYVLDLDRENLQQPASGAPLVVVDDCSLTGARFAQFLESEESAEIIFAHLYSHPQLRAAILRRESRVRACVAAHDLRDLGPEILGGEHDYSAWQDRWRRRLPQPRYWIGLLEPVSFAWSEPDRPAWNPATGRLQDTWRLTPPDRCLKNWARLGLPPRTDAEPRLRSPDHVSHSLAAGQVILCNLATEQIYRLEDPAAAMWRGLVAYGDPAVVVELLKDEYDVDEVTLSNDVRVFIESLLAAGLLELTEESGSV